MRKSFNTYIAIWATALVLFNLIIFVVPSSIDEKTVIAIVSLISQYETGLIETIPNFANTVFYKYGGAFWPCYVIIMFAFIGQLFCAYNTFKETNNQKFFYKVPLITISYTGLIATLVTSILGMFLPNFPIWLAVTICIVVLVITIVSLLKANLAGNITSVIDNKIEKETAFIKEMTAKAKSLWDTDKSNDDLRKLYEAFRYKNINSNLEETYIMNTFIKIKQNKKTELINELIRYINNN